MTTSASINIDAADLTDRPLLVDHNDSHANKWAIRLVDLLDHQVWITGTVEELDEAHVRFGEHIVALRARIAAKREAVEAVQGIAHLAGIETEVTA